jgi:PAS domain-containing protein
VSTVGRPAYHPFGFLPDPVLCLDGAGTLVAANAAARNLLALDPGALAAGALAATLAGGWVRLDDNTRRRRQRARSHGKGYPRNKGLGERVKSSPA